MARRSNYDKFPFVAVGNEHECSFGWEEIGNRLRETVHQRRVLAVECYPGVAIHEIDDGLRTYLPFAKVLLTQDCLKTPAELHEMLDPVLGTDRVFGRMNGIQLEDYFHPAKLHCLRDSIERIAKDQPVIVLGTGATIAVREEALLLYADLARWEIQLRWKRQETGNLGLDNSSDDFERKYKCGYFVEWRAADNLKRDLLPKLDFLLDTNTPHQPKLISGANFRRALQETARRPFRVVPYFDPGPWGGHWMEEVCDLSRDVPNHAWCFDCVPEENSLLLGFGRHRVEVPSIDLVFAEPRSLLGDAVHARFGAEFPIRFDFLDTMGGGNLSLQVHPLTEYIQARFGMNYTQDESYYLLDAGPNATVYLGLKENISSRQMIEDLYRAQKGEIAFPVEEYVNRWPARKHDHFLIPAGTIHCSGAESMVLEISATPYIFTFKLWDWGRVGLNGRPRPIHIANGVPNIQWDRTTHWVERELINRVALVSEGDCWREERTGLHESEFIETRRHWFKGTVPHESNSRVNVLNLVEGEEVLIESPTTAFSPYVAHYAETFIVPAAAGPYTVTPHGPSAGKLCGTIKAFVRTKA